MATLSLYCRSFAWRGCILGLASLMLAWTSPARAQSVRHLPLFAEEIDDPGIASEGLGSFSTDSSSFAFASTYPPRHTAAGPYPSSLTPLGLSLTSTAAGYLKPGFQVFTRLPGSGSLSTTRLTFAGAVVVGSLGITHYFQQRAWWLGERSQLWFKADQTYALNMDKWGHLYGSYALSRLFGYALTWCGLERPKSTRYAAGLAAFYQLLLEVEDGFRKDFGFDPLDGFANIAGAAIPLLQESVPVLRNFALKYSYFPSTAWSSRKGNRIFIDDYDGMTLWLAMDPHFLLSERLSASIPPWLGISAGYAVRGATPHGKGERVYYLTLDYNLSKIGTDSDFLHALFTAIDFIHLPAPGLRFSSGKISFGVFYR